MLPSHWRIEVENQTGVSIDVEIKFRGFKFDSNGALTYGTWTTDLGTTGLASGSFFTTAEQDNTSDLFLGGLLEVVVSDTGSPLAGDVKVRVQGRGDGATDWPDQGEGYTPLVISESSTGTFRRTREI